MTWQRDSRRRWRQTLADYQRGARNTANRDQQPSRQAVAPVNKSSGHATGLLNREPSGCQEVRPILRSGQRQTRPWPFSLRQRPRPKLASQRSFGPPVTDAAIRSLPPAVNRTESGQAGLGPILSDSHPPEGSRVNGSVHTRPRPSGETRHKGDPEGLLSAPPPRSAGRRKHENASQWASRAYPAACSACGTAGRFSRLDSMTPETIGAERSSGRPQHGQPRQTAAAAARGTRYGTPPPAMPPAISLGTFRP